MVDIVITQIQISNLLRSSYILFLILIAIFGIACSEKQDSDDNRLSKIAIFKKYVEALDACKGLPVDSVQECAKRLIDIDTVSGIETEVWYNYGKARAFFHNKKDVEALGVIGESLKKTEGFPLLFERAEFLALRSVIHRNNYKQYLAAEDVYSAADIYLRLGLSRSASSIYLDIANLQCNVGNYSLALDNGHRVVNLIENNLPLTAEDSSTLMNVYNTLGLCYFSINDLDSAEYFYDRSYDLAVQLESEFWQGLLSGNSAMISKARGRFDEAIQKLEYDIRLSLKYREFYSAGSAYIIIGDLCVQSDNLSLAKQYYDSALYYLKPTGRLPALKLYYKNISHWHELMNDTGSAYSSYKKHILLRDSIKGTQVGAQMRQIQDQRQFEKQLADIELLKAENDHRERELRMSRVLLVALILVFVLLVALLFTIRRNYKKLNELNLQLEDKVKVRTERLKNTIDELDTYLYRASHDVRRPILTIVGLTQIADATTVDEELGEIHRAIKKTALEMDNMLKKLQMAYELEKENTQLAVNLDGQLTKLIYSFKKDFSDVLFKIECKHDLVVNSNPALLDIIFANVIENACIFSRDGHQHEISIDICRARNYAKILIKDNGLGIDDCYLKDIFSPYTRFSNKSHGCGLGLYLVVKALKRIGGKIVVSSTPNKGSKFLITIPVKYSMEPGIQNILSE